MPFPRQTQQTTIIFEGGLDLDTPPTQVPGGRLLLCKNWIADSSGGYREFDGFVHIDPTVPQEWLISIVREPGDGPVVVETVEVAAGAADFIVQPPIDDEEVYLVISAAARISILPAEYQLKFEIVS